MSATESLTVTIAVEAEVAPDIHAALVESSIPVQPAGPARGALEAATVIIALVPSVASLALLLEKLRRLRLPRTYVVAGADRAVDIYTDETVRDGRILIVRADEQVIELPDQEITVAALIEALRLSPPQDE